MANSAQGTVLSAGADPSTAQGKYEAKPIEQASPSRQLKLAITRVMVVLATIFTARYFWWRFFHTMNPAARIFFYTFLAVEILSFIESALFYYVTWKPTAYARPEPIQGRTVDVLIPTYNEPVELLRETILCAVNMRYPHKTFVLDDGNRPEVRQLAEEFDCGYITREKREHAKAGNLNNGLQQTSGEFLVTLDADHVASPELIEEMIGFFADPKVSIVQGTQDFYNLDSFQHQVDWESRIGWQQQELFFSVIQPGKDRHNAAFYCGSPGMLRRKAIEDIGGFPTDSITEDMHTSMKLQKKDWRVIYINRTLARGLAPQTFTGFATQWQRWGHGNMQVMRTEKPLFSRELTFGQKVCYFSSLYFYWMSYEKLFMVLTPIISLFFGVFVMVTDPVSYASYFLPYFLLNLACSVIVQGGFRNFWLGERFNLLKMHVLMRSIGGIFQRDSLFFVTPKARASAARASEVLLPLIILAGLALSLAAGVIRIEQVPRWGYVFWALAVNIFWAVMFIFMIGTVVRRSLIRKEMRQSYRFPARLGVRMRVTFKDRVGNVVTREQFARNLNRSGVSVTLESAIEPGTPVQLEMQLPEHVVQAEGMAVRNQTFGSNGHSRISTGIQFQRISPMDQDAITKYLFWHIAPQEGQVLNLTHSTQAEGVR
ncbi:MAG: glycosyltransferase [Acidobacteriia bacterium]|nr:glycosyltransferase [Terriglobia bacterium]